MVITISCPSCASSFPVDTAKVPEGGVNARCSSCGDVFRVEKPEETAPEAVMELPEIAEPEPIDSPPPPPVESAPAEPVAAVAEEPFVEGDLSAAPDVTGGFAAPEEPMATLEAPPADESAAPTLEEAPITPAPSEAAEPTAEEVSSGFRFGKRDPTDKAKRLARVLVSDMIMYNAERHQSALASGTLTQDFEEEIEKSWKEFVEQVGAEMADGPGRGFWIEALNDILAKGEEVF